MMNKVYILKSSYFKEEYINKMLIKIIEKENLEKEIKYNKLNENNDSLLVKVMILLNEESKIYNYREKSLLCNYNNRPRFLKFLLNTGWGTLVDYYNCIIKMNFID